MYIIGLRKAFMQMADFHLNAECINCEKGHLRNFMNYI